MKSLEQTGEPPKQSAEEIAEMNQQRRKGLGLGEEKELTPKEIEKLEESIAKLLGDLNQYDFESCSPEAQEEWYGVEQEAGAGRDRELAEANLKRFLNILQEEAERLDE